MLEINNSTVFKLKTTVLIKNISEKNIFLLDSDTGKQYNLTDLEYDIITMISKGLAFGDIVLTIASNYNETIGIVEKDIRDYCTSLFKANLIL